MAQVTYNERSWAIDVISEINVFLRNKSWYFKSAGGENTIKNNRTSLFPDVLIFKDQTKNIVTTFIQNSICSKRMIEMLLLKATHKSKVKDIILENQQQNMVIITLQRAKCIGCNYCVELAPAQFQMSKKDGKSVLLHSKEKKGFFTIKSPDETIFNASVKAKQACPVKIIDVKQT